jgi:hypothetical protein
MYRDGLALLIKLQPTNPLAYVISKKSDYSAYRILSLRTTALTALLEKG